MLVCPNCRSENPEDASVCHACARSVLPTDAPMRSPVERERPQDALDVPPPKPPRIWPVVVTGVVVVLAGSGLWLWSATRPDPCRGKFTSALYPYCVDIPPGWNGDSLRTPIGAADRFEPAADGALVTVRAGEVVPGITTQEYAQGFRTTQEAVGLSIGRMGALELDESEALTWEWTGSTDDGVIVRQREVVVVRSGQGWRITLVSDGNSFDEAHPVFQELLASWEWR